MPDQKPSRGFSGALVKLWRGGDYELTVTGRTELTPNYLRLHFEGKDLLTGRTLHPTMWVRGWFPDGAKSHQRGYTLVNADAGAGTVDIDFAMHDGLATRWASLAKVGDTLEVTVLGSNFTLPEPAPAGYVIVGDAASLPAINSLLDAIDDGTPTKVFMEAAHDDDRELPVGTDEVTWVDRKKAGEALVEAVGASAFDAADHFGWVACDNRTTRAVAKIFREDYKIPRKSIKAQAYWVA
ncbi:siderophore-interacting protein [Mycolicibacterium sp. P9-64]|uniref:siderophore-interacting protein n=1 Tax=Mycolicibacterium sp. P9-64 TaxID=2024612 RepID=UPI0011EEDF0D|nr:siderophore-interacting protein [Mycolicibacterium sp. P9-64]KAA0079479.1 siderophore-interacting protein [Mycolicibacterium sp. P9-64]